MKRWMTVVLALVAIAGASVGAFVAAAPWIPTGPVTEGVLLEGAPFPRGANVTTWLEERAKVAMGRRVALHYPGGHFELSLAELGLVVDTLATEARLREVGHAGPLLRRAREARAARRGNVAMGFAYRLDREMARDRVRRLAEEFDREAVPASIDLDQHARTVDVPGRHLDVDSTVELLVARVDALATGREFAVELPYTASQAPVTSSDLRNVDVTKVLASFETQYSLTKVGRSKNVVLAAKKLDGLVIPPGGTMSFNDRIGPRTREAGFVLAPEIINDELSDGFGGGTCQVSSTLFGAAVQGGLEIVSRRNHSRLSDYTRVGLDATVKYPSIDLKLRNGFDFGVVIHAFIPKPGTLRVEILGGDAIESAKYDFVVSNVEPFLRRITEKAELQPGSSVRRQKGTRKMDVHSTMTLRYKDGRVERRTFFSGYKATPEVYWVGPDFDRSTLPPLPEHASGVEGEPPPSEDDAFSG